MSIAIKIPKAKNFPPDSVQCGGCGGLGCEDCNEKGWFSTCSHSLGRKCFNSFCNNPICPDSISIYCSDECAALDA